MKSVKTFFRFLFIGGTIFTTSCVNKNQTNQECSIEDTIQVLESEEEVPEDESEEGVEIREVQFEYLRDYQEGAIKASVDIMEDTIKVTTLDIVAD